MVLSYQGPKLGNLRDSHNSERRSELLKRLVDARGLEPLTSSEQVVGSVIEIGSHRRTDGAGSLRVHHVKESSKVAQEQTLLAAL